MNMFPCSVSRNFPQTRHCSLGRRPLIRSDVLYSLVLISIGLLRPSPGSPSSGILLTFPTLNLLFYPDDGGSKFLGYLGTIPEDCNIHSQRRENSKSHRLVS
jgi:hypothetical protein